MTPHERLTIWRLVLGKLLPGKTWRVMLAEAEFVILVFDAIVGVSFKSRRGRRIGDSSWKAFRNTLRSLIVIILLYAGWFKLNWGKGQRRSISLSSRIPIAFRDSSPLKSSPGSS
jgi:hypothetical protein